MNMHIVQNALIILQGFEPDVESQWLVCFLCVSDWVLHGVFTLACTTELCFSSADTDACI